MSEAETAAVLAPFVRPSADIDVLQKATQALEGALRDRGFGLHRVALPPQEMTDQVRLEVVKFAIGAIGFEGRSAYSEANLRASLPELQVGATPNFKRLAVQTGIANESAGKQVTVALKESAQPDRVDVALQVKETRPWAVSLNASNTGNDSSGRDRVTVSLAHANFWDLDHSLSVSLTTSAERPESVKQYGLSYRVPLYGLGGVLNVSATQSNVLGNFGAFTSTGAGRTRGASYVQHLQPDGGYKSFVSAAFDDKVFDVAQINGVVLPGQLARRSSPVTVGYSARLEADGRFLTYNLDLAANISGGGGNDLLAYQSEDPRVQTTSWRALRGGVSWSQAVFKDASFSARLQFQYANAALISGEQFGIGGNGSVRGAAERPVSADRGAQFSLEIGSPELAPGLRALAFVDAGYLSNVVANGTTKLAHDKLVSVGLGLRYAHSAGWGINADYGRLTSGSAVPLFINAGAPKRGDEKIHLNLSARF